MNVSRAGALVNCAVTFSRQWLGINHAAAAKLGGIFLAERCYKSSQGEQNADIFVFTEAPAFAGSTGRG